MPSPFPGMDPWLEDPAVWPGMHHLLIAQSAAFLQPQLRPRGYFADPGERVWLVEPRRPVYPDVAVRRMVRSPAHGNGGVALIEADQPVRIGRFEVEIHEPFLEIRRSVDGRLVTGIEFVSPTNKSDRKGRELYEQKQQELRGAAVNLVEIDFIRRGPHVLDVPLEFVEPLRPWEYLVNLVRHGSQEYEVYPIQIRDPLPRILIPLGKGEEDTVLDLQAVFNDAWTIGPYPERLDYTRDPIPPLKDDDAAWADQLLRDKGFRQ